MSATGFDEIAERIDALRRDPAALMVIACLLDEALHRRRPIEFQRLLARRGISGWHGRNLIARYRSQPTEKRMGARRQAGQDRTAEEAPWHGAVGQEDR